MKPFKFFIILIIILISNCVSTETKTDSIQNNEPVQNEQQLNKEPVQKTDIEKLQDLLDIHHELVSGYEDQNIHFAQSYAMFKDSVNSGKTKILISEDEIGSLLNGASFNVSWETGDNYLEINKELIDRYEEFPSLFHSILAHEIWHFYDYTTDPDNFKFYNTDPFEEIMYEMDAYFVEALFIIEVLKQNDFELTNFEEYLANCVAADSLASFSIVFKQTDLDTVHQLYFLRSDYYSDSLSRNDFYSRIISIGNEVNDYYLKNSETKDHWIYFTAMIALNTYNIYLKHLLDQITYPEYNTYGDLFIDYPEIQELNNDFTEIVNNNLEFINNYKNFLLDDFIEEFN